MKDRKIKIAYIDDDDAVIYGSFMDIEEEIEKMDISELELQLHFFKIKDEQSKEDFWNRLLANRYQGIILDYKLVNSMIFDNANSIWRRIKTHNPFFPLAIYTSNRDEVSIKEEAEIIFEKGNTEHTQLMINYLLKQVNHNLESIRRLEKANYELKSDQDVSYAVLKNEEIIENQFSLFFESDFSESDDDKFKKLMSHAFSIIDKYSQENGNS